MDQGVGVGVGDVGRSVIVGPAVGGIFAQFGIWRWAFGSLAIMTAAMAALVPGALPARQHSETAVAAIPRIPLWSLLLLGAAALATSVAGVQRSGAATFGLLAVGAVLVGLFLVVDRRARATVLPRSAFGPGPLKWMYVTIGLLMAATMVDMYVPLFGQRLAGMAPAARGILRRGARGRVDGLGDRQCIARPDSHDCPPGRRRARHHGGRPRPRSAGPG